MKAEKHNIFRYLGVVILVILCLVICWFSAQGGKISSLQSDFFVDKIIAEFFPDFNSYNADAQEDLRLFLAKFVRKGAHFLAYTGMGMISFLAFFRVKKYGARFLGAVGFTFAFACLDEIHQLFVPGRSGRIFDVMLDTCGGIFGAFIVFSITVAIAYGKNSRKIEEKC